MDCEKQARADRGKRAWHSGISAEESVERFYQDRDMQVAARRWRKGGGELDLVVRDGDALIFVEVKKSRDFERAAERVSERQVGRIRTGAQIFLESEPMGELTECRFDVALVNERGEIRILENAF